MKKYKILQMPVRNAKGGITQYALRNWEHIDKSRFVFDWVTLDKELDFESELSEQGCTVHHVSCRQEDDEEKFRAEMSAILSAGYDAIHLHTSYWRGFLAEELAIAAKIPRIIVHAHSTGVDVSDDTVRVKLINAHNDWKARFNSGLATHFTACSALAASFLFGPQIPKEQVKILKNAIDVERFTFNRVARTELRRRLNLTDNFVILQPTRLVYQKNPAFTLEVFAGLSEQISNAVLLFAGDGELRSALKAEAARCGISCKVQFLGFRQDIPELLCAADLMVMPSHFEGLSISAIEAQCSGVPCLFSAGMSEETVILDNAVRLPLDTKLWCGTITDIARRGYERQYRSNDIAAAGYSLKDQIKILEKIYIGETT